MRADLGEAQLRLFLERWDPGEVDILGKALSFLAGHAIDLLLLPAEVPLVFEIGFDERPDILGKFLEDFIGESLPARFGTAEPMVELEPLEDGIPDPGIGALEIGGLGSHPLDPFAGGKADRGGFGGQPQIRIVLPEQQAVFRPAGEHTVGLGATAGHEVIDHHTEICLIAPEDEGSFPLHFERGVCPGDEPLPCRFLVSGGAVDLASEIQTLHPLCLKGRLELGRRAVIILHRIAGAKDLAFLQPGDGAEEIHLHLIGKRGRNPVHVVFQRVPTFRLQEHLMPLLLREADNLVLDGRTIARADALDHPAIHGGLVEVVGDDLVGLRVRVGDPARDLFHVERRIAPRIQGEDVIPPLPDPIRHETEFRHR